MYDLLVTVLCRLSRLNSVACDIVLFTGATRRSTEAEHLVLDLPPHTVTDLLYGTSIQR